MWTLAIAVCLSVPCDVVTYPGCTMPLGICQLGSAQALQPWYDLTLSGRGT